MTKHRSQRIAWPDTAKALGLLLVFWGHLLEKVLPDPAHGIVGVPLAFTAFKLVYAFHIPLFFVLAGMFFRRQDSLRFGQLLVLRCKTRLLPILFFCALAIPFWMTPLSWGLQDTGKPWVEIFDKSWLLLRGLPALNWVCWFLVCLFSVELMAAELIPFLDSGRRKITALLGLAALGYLLTRQPELAAQKLGLTKNWWFLQEAVVALPLYLLGHFYAATWLQPSPRQRSLAIAIGCTVVFLLSCDLNMKPPGPPTVNMSGSEHGNIILFYLTAMAGTVAMLEWSRLLPQTRLLAYIGENTLPLMGLNGLLLQFFNKPIADVLARHAQGGTLVLLFLLVAAASMLACLPFAWLLNRYLPWAVGRWKTTTPAPARAPLTQAPASAAPLRSIKPGFLASNAVLWAAAATCVILFYLQPGSAIVRGLDSSWAYGLNYVYAHHLVMGRDVVFTFGPLGFLEHVRPLTYNIVLFSSLFWDTVSLLLFFILLRTLVDTWAGASWLNRILSVLAIGLLMVSLNSPVQRLLYLTYALCLLFAFGGKKKYLYLAAALAPLSLLIKFSYGMTAFAFLGLFLLTHALQSRDVRTAAKAALLSAITYFLCWFFLYSSLAGSIGYLLGGLQFSKGSVSAMATNPAHNTGAIVLFYACIGAAFAILLAGRQALKQNLLLTLPFAGVLFIWTRYAFGREDVIHLIFLFSFSFYTPLLLAPFIAGTVRKIAFIVVMALSLPVWYHIMNLPYGFIDTQPAAVYYPLSTAKARLKLHELMNTWRQQTHEELATLVMPDDLRARIGDSTVDIYPWQSVIAHANQLNWKPRPVFQNYITYTPTLDRLNADFIASANRPRFLVWHLDAEQDIDNRYPFSSDPLTLEAFMRWYHPVAREGNFYLFEAQDTPLLAAAMPAGSTDTAWGEWIPVPDPGDSILRAQVHVDRTLPGKLNGTFWKEGDVFIDYRLNDGREISHALVIDNAASGAWISPYVTGIKPVSDAQAVDAQAAASDLDLRPCEGYIEKADIQGDSLRLSGWGACIDRNSDGQRIDILLKGRDHAYRASATVSYRAEISEHFGVKGRINMDNSGFATAIPLSKLAEDTYTAYIVLTVNGERFVNRNPRGNITVSATAAASNHNVQAIRIRSNKPWAFQPPLHIDWMTYQYTGSDRYF